MKNKFWAFISILLVLSITFSSAVVAFASESNCEANTLYITSQTSQVLTHSSEYIGGLDTENGDITASLLSEYDNIIVDIDRFNNAAKVDLLSAYNNQCRIFVLGDASVNSVRSYFGLDMIAEDISKSMNEVKSENSIGTLENTVDMSSFDVLGVLVYRDISGTNVTQVRIESLADKELIATALQYCFSYDYFSLANISGNSMTVTADYTNSWTNVDVTTETFVATRCTVSSSLKLDKNAGNPNSNGEYLQYTPYVVEVDVNSGSTVYSVRKVEVEVKGGANSTIYDYGPLNQSCGASASVSFGLPYSINVSFTPGSKVSISKVSGGINSNSVKICYQPKTLIGIDGYEYDGIRCEAHIEAYQSNNKYLYGYGQYSVHTYEHDSYSGDPINYLKYTNSEWDIASGS